MKQNGINLLSFDMASNIISQDFFSVFRITAETLEGAR